MSIATETDSLDGESGSHTTDDDDRDGQHTLTESGRSGGRGGGGASGGKRSECTRPVPVSERS